MSKIIIKPEGPEELRTLVKGALENEIKLIMIGLRKAKENLRNYEDKFKMDSETFYKNMYLEKQGMILNISGGQEKSRH